MGGCLLVSSLSALACGPRPHEAVSAEWVADEGNGESPVVRIHGLDLHPAEVRVYASGAFAGVQKTARAGTWTPEPQLSQELGDVTIEVVLPPEIVSGLAEYSHRVLQFWVEVVPVQQDGLRGNVVLPPIRVLDGRPGVPMAWSVVSGSLGSVEIHDGEAYELDGPTGLPYDPATVDWDAHTSWEENR